MVLNILISFYKGFLFWGLFWGGGVCLGFLLGFFVFFYTLEVPPFSVLLSLSIYFCHFIVNMNEQSQLKMSHLSKNVIEIMMSSSATEKHHIFLRMIFPALPVT